MITGSWICDLTVAARVRMGTSAPVNAVRMQYLFPPIKMIRLANSLQTPSSVVKNFTQGRNNIDSAVTHSATSKATALSYTWCRHYFNSYRFFVILQLPCLTWQGCLTKRLVWLRPHGLRLLPSLLLTQQQYDDFSNPIAESFLQYWSRQQNNILFYLAVAEQAFTYAFVFQISLC